MIDKIKEIYENISYRIYYTNKPNKELKFLIRFLKERGVYNDCYNILTKIHGNKNIFKKIKFILKEHNKCIDYFFTDKDIFGRWFDTDIPYYFYFTLCAEWRMHCIENKRKIKINKDALIILKHDMEFLRRYEGDFPNKSELYSNMFHFYLKEME